MIIGMDFGTTNSGLALFDGRVRLLPVDPAGAIPQIVPTTLYLSRGYQPFIGREAIEEYYEMNQGRPVHLRREYVGTISLTYADLGTFARDVYVWVDELEPGRLFRSLKTYLPDKDYLGTSVWSQFYRLEDLVAEFLHITRSRSQQLLGKEIDEIVLGRPVVFSTDPQEDRLAEERLARAAILAGYGRVYFELEPVAAALSYGQALHAAQRVLVFDLGGGTLDIAVMETDGTGRRRVLSTGGLRIAGDLFDRRIVRRRLAKHFGERTTYGPKGLTMPAYLYEELCEWQTLLLLNRPEVLKFLSEAEAAANHPKPIRALTNLIRNNYGLLMFDRVERAKSALSSTTMVTIRVQAGGLDVEEPLSRPEFEQIIHHDAAQISACVDEALAAAGLRPQEIDAVVRTGGSSLIPLFQRMLADKFGADKVKPVDEFTGVAAGLAIAAHRVARGELELPSYDNEILTTGEFFADREPLKEDDPAS